METEEVGNSQRFFIFKKTTMRIALASNNSVCVHMCICASVFFYLRLKVNNNDVKELSNFYFPNIVPEKHG